MMRRAWLVFGAAILSMVGTVGCDKDESYATTAEVTAAINDTIPKCTPGRALDCPCPGGFSGVQVCAADGKSFGACGECAGPTTGSSSSSSSSSSGSGGGNNASSQMLSCDGMTSDPVVASFPGRAFEEVARAHVFTKMADPLNPGHIAWSAQAVFFLLENGDIRLLCTPGMTKDYLVVIP